MQLKTNRAGFFVNCSTAGESFAAFVPNPLPPAPPLELGAEHFDRLERANRALGKLDGLSRFLPDVSLFVYWFVRKEAVLSSQIEGTQSSLSDLLLYEQKQILNWICFNQNELGNNILYFPMPLDCSSSIKIDVQKPMKIMEC